MVFTDVTDQKRAKALLERYRAFFERARDIILFIDPEDGRILEANEAAVRAYGYSRDELLRLTVYDLRAPQTASLVAPQMAEAAAKGILFETTHRRQDGSTFPVEISSQWAPWDDRSALLSIIRDISERKQAEDALRKAKDYAERLIETANVMIVGLDADGNIRVFNPAAEEITGYSQDELRGRSWFEVLVPRERYPQVWDVFSRAVSEGVVPRIFENPIVTKSGEERYILFRNSVLQQDGRITGTISFGIDITESKRAEAERDRLLGELQEVNERLLQAGVRERALAEESARRAAEAEAALRLRDEFLNVAAHELKTPLTSLRGHAELTIKRIEEGRIWDVQQVHGVLEVIDRQVDRFSNLVAQLLDIARIESGELQLDRQSVDLVPLTRRMVETMQAGATRHTLSLQAPGSLPAFVDPLRLEEVLYNLLDNAIRYSPRGGPVEVELSTPGADTVRLAVRDHGIGVPPEQRERLFTRFFQAARRPAGGLGLGLYVNRRIVELHGGRIWAEFPEGGGSRFVVELPRQGTEGIGEKGRNRRNRGNRGNQGN